MKLQNTLKYTGKSYNKSLSVLSCCTSTALITLSISNQTCLLNNNDDAIITIRLVLFLEGYIYFCSSHWQAALEVIELDKATLFWAGKDIERGKKLCDYIGKNEKTKIVCKLQVFKLLFLRI